MFESFDAWMFLAGLGIFLFGIYMMEESIKLLSGRAFKGLIRRYTATPIKGIMTGSISTAVLQSSSAVSLMVLAFVGAGIMNLINAIAVIILYLCMPDFRGNIIICRGFPLCYFMGD
jgi:phosphate:Na+ symporter